MSVLLVVNTVPCGGEGRHACVRLTDASSLRGERLRHARPATIHDLAEATCRNDRVVSF